MDPLVTGFLKRISKSILLVLLWLMALVLAGVKWNLLFVENGWNWKHIVFYVVMIAALVWIVFTIIKIWKKQEDWENMP
jgi:predicted membrane channel-forming protein YqfA (hemolysin III family)